MATNRSKARGRQFYCVPTDGGVNSGDPCLLGSVPGVAMNNKDSANGNVIDTLGVYSLSVKGLGTGAANAAVNSGDILYYVPGNTPKLSKASDGVGAVRYGYALGPTGVAGSYSGVVVASGATTTIDVRLGY